jgi:hypothetical protein
MSSCVHQRRELLPPMAATLSHQRRALSSSGESCRHPASAARAAELHLAAAARAAAVLYGPAARAAVTQWQRRELLSSAARATEFLIASAARAVAVLSGESCCPGIFFRGGHPDAGRPPRQQNIHFELQLACRSRRGHPFDKSNGGFRRPRLHVQHDEPICVFQMGIFGVLRRA